MVDTSYVMLGAALLQAQQMKNESLGFLFKRASTYRDSLRHSLEGAAWSTCCDLAFSLFVEGHVFHVLTGYKHLTYIF